MTGLLRHPQHSHVTLAQDMPHQNAARHALVHYKTGSILSFIPKNACTTLRLSLAIANNCIPDASHWMWVHENNQTFAASLADLVRARYSAVILRCPFSRLASAFSDKIVGKERDLWDLQRMAGSRFDPDTLTFRQFVEMLGQTHLRVGNIHWRPQVQFLVYENYSDWFCVERFEEAARVIEDKTGMAIMDARSLSRHGTETLTHLTDACYADLECHKIASMRREGCIPGHAALYDDDLIARVAELYALDLRCYIARVGREGLTFPDFDKSEAA